jgi:ribosome-associated translation inhibitor RaiA
VLSLASPLLGALLLHRLTDITLGPGALSWFSTSLFVLATSLRPWSHLIERLHDRADALHDAIHYPSTNETRKADVLRKELRALQARLDLLEGSVKGVEGQVEVRAKSEDVYEHVDDALDAVESVLRAHERKGAAVRAAQDARLAALEGALSAVQLANAQERVVYVQTASPGLLAVLGALAPKWALPAQVLKRPKYYAPTSPVRERDPRRKLRLETIPEELFTDNEAVINGKPTISSTKDDAYDSVFYYGGAATEEPGEVSAPPTYMSGRGRHTYDTKKGGQRRLWWRRIPGLALMLKFAALITLPARVIFKAILPRVGLTVRRAYSA